MLVGWLSQDGSSVLPPLSLFCQLSVSSRFSSFPLFFLHDLLLTLRLLLPASSPFPPVEKEQINKTNKRHFLCTRVVMFSCFHRLEIIRFSHVHLLSLKSLVICFWGRGGGGFFFFGLTVGVCDHVLDRQKQQSQGAGSRVIQPVMLFQKHPSPVLIRDFYARRILTQPGLLHRD